MSRCNQETITDKFSEQFLKTLKFDESNSTGKFELKLISFYNCNEFFF